MENSLHDMLFLCHSTEFYVQRERHTHSETEKPLKNLGRLIFRFCGKGTEPRCIFLPNPEVDFVLRNASRALIRFEDLTHFYSFTLNFTFTVLIIHLISSHNLQIVPSTKG